MTPPPTPHPSPEMPFASIIEPWWNITNLQLCLCFSLNSDRLTQRSHGYTRMQAPTSAPRVVFTARTNYTRMIHIRRLVIVHVCYDGIFLSALADVARLEFAFIPGKQETCQTGSFTAAYTYAFPYIMHVMHLCYAKEAWWKEFFYHWEMEIWPPLLLLPLPAVISVDERCSSAHGGENLLHSNLVETAYLAFFAFRVLLLCKRRMDRKTLMKRINYSRSILLTVSLLISQLCTFTTHLLTLQVQRGNISHARLLFVLFIGWRHKT